MFCRQCEQARDGVACTTLGVCGKDPDASSLQDALVHVIKAVSMRCVAIRNEVDDDKSDGVGADKDLDKDKDTREEEEDEEEIRSLLRRASEWTVRSAFVTMTNVNFSDRGIAQYAREGLALRNELDAVILSMGGGGRGTPGRAYDRADLLDLYIGRRVDPSVEDLEHFGRRVSVPIRRRRMADDDCFALNELATAGLKGLCAYASHCYRLGHDPDDDSILKNVHELWSVLDSDDPDFDSLLDATLKVGAVNGDVLRLLDDAHVSSFGVPEPTMVRTTAVKGKCILVSGHDLMDLHALLEQTAGTGINVYTHGEMLPANAYPELKKHGHLVGNYGTAWQNQGVEFAMFPGPIVVTTNCVLKPRRAYKDRLFTMNQVDVGGNGEVGRNGTSSPSHHIGDDRNFSDVIEMARTCKGFGQTVEPARYHPAGYNHNTSMPLPPKEGEGSTPLASTTTTTTTIADMLANNIQSGSLKRILVIGLCDGTEWDRSYYTDLGDESPSDSVILTMGCAKNRLLRSTKLTTSSVLDGKEGGNMSGGSGSRLPRLIDMGQCNDFYSALIVAKKLAERMAVETAGETSQAPLPPVSFALSHMEQKSVACILTLLSWGLAKNVRMGPRLPAYLTPRVLDVLGMQFGLSKTGVDAKGDLRQMMDGN